MVQVDKDRLLAAANAVRTGNDSISNAFDEVKTAVSRMDPVWDGKASQNAMEAYNKLINAYCSPRSNVLESIARVLDGIANGYELTEETNTSLADRFK